MEFSLQAKNYLPLLTPTPALNGKIHYFCLRPSLPDVNILNNNGNIETTTTGDLMGTEGGVRMIVLNCKW